MRSFRAASTLASSNPRIRTISAMVSFLLCVELLLSSLIFPDPVSAAGTPIPHKKLTPGTGTYIVPYRDLVIGFDEPVYRGTGEIELRGSAKIASIPVTDTARVQLDNGGRNVVIKFNLDPATLDLTQSYSVIIPEGVFYVKRSDGNYPHAGIAPGEWSFWFKTFGRDEIDPNSLVPARDETFVVAGKSINLQFAFKEIAKKGTGYLRIRRKTDDVIVQSVNVNAMTITDDTSTNTSRVTVGLDKLDYNTEYYVTIDYGAFLDQHDNPFEGVADKSFWTFKTEPPLDTTKPKAVAYTPAINGTLGNLQGTLTIEFDDPVFTAGGFINIYKNTSGQPLFCAIPVQSSAVTVNGKNVVIHPGGYGCGAFENNVQYRVQIGADAFRDASGNYFAGVSNWTFRASQDKTPPSTSSYSPSPGSSNVSVATKTFSVTFNEPVTASGTAHLFPTNNPGSRQTLSMSVDSSNNRKVNLSYTGSNLTANTQYSITIPEGAIRDLAGNEFPGILGTFQWTFRTGGTATEPVLERAEMDGSSAILLIFNVTLSNAQVPHAGNFYVTVNGVFRPVTGVTVNQNRVRLTLASAVSSGQTVRVSYSQDPYLDSRHLQSLDGQKVAPFTDRTVTGAGSSGAARPVSGTIYGNTIILNFSRPLASLAASAYLQFAVRVGGQSVTVTGAAATGSELSLTLAAPVTSSAAVSVSYTPGSNPLRDEDNNQVAAFTDFFVANPNDVQPPQLTGATASGTKVVLIYNEGLNTGSVPLPTSYSVVASNRTIPVTMVAVSGNQVELTLASALASGEIVRVPYTPSSPFLSDLSGNSAPAIAGYQVTAVGGTSGAKAQLVYASANGAQLTLSYNAELNLSYVPLAGQYTVTADNATVAVAGVTVSGSQVILTLAAPVRAGQAVRVSYNTSGNPLRDAQNNVLDSFSGVTVANATSTVNLGLDYGSADAQRGVVLNNLAVTTGSGRTISGTAAVKYTVDETKLTGAFNAIRNQPGGLPRRVVFQVPAAQPGAIVAVPASAVTGAAGTVPDGAFAVEYGGHMFELPLKAIHPSRVPGGIPPGAQIVIKIEPVSASSFSSALSRQGATLVGTPVEFGVYIASGASETPVTEFDAYARRAIAVGAAQIGPNTIVVRYDPETGELSHVPTRIDRSGPQPVLTFTRKGTSVYMAARKTSASFADMAGHWARSDVELLSAKFIVDAKTGQNFAPKEAVTRADFAKFIARGLGLSSDRASAARFRDIGVNHAYAPYIGAASKAGIVEGDTDGRFRPNDPITREEMAAMMMRAIAYAEGQGSLSTAALNKFEDRTRISNWAVSSVAGAVNAGIIKGVTETRFEPKNNATRAEAAVMIKRMLEFVGFLET